MQILFKILTFLSFILINVKCEDENGDSNIPANQINPIEAITLDIPEPSGIAYNHKNNSLYVVSDGQADIFEINFQGERLRTITTTSSDMEGVAVSKTCDTIFVVEEKNKLITAYSSSGTRLYSFSKNVATSSNSALEGITRDNKNGYTYVINEKDPMMIIKLKHTTEIWRKNINFVWDISDIYYEEEGNFLWLLSDESQKICKLTETGELIAEWRIPFSKGEGITMVGDKMYIVNDNTRQLSIFNKPN